MSELMSHIPKRRKPPTKRILHMILSYCVIAGEYTTLTQCNASGIVTLMPKTTGPKRTMQLVVRVTPKEYAFVRRGARACDKSPSEYVRWRLLGLLAKETT